MVKHRRLSSPARTITSRATNQLKRLQQAFSRLDRGESSRSIASDYHLSNVTLSRKYKRYCSIKGQDLSVNEVITELDRSGQHCRVFTAKEERCLADMIRALAGTETEFIHSDLVRTTAAAYWKLLHPQHTRSQKYEEFNGSDGWISGFKNRQGFAIRCFRPKRKVTEVTASRKDAALVEYSCLVREAIAKYGADRVVNMDETPVKPVDCPKKIWCDRGSKSPKFRVKGNPRLNFTFLPCVTASGHLLPLSFIGHGTTRECIDNMGPLPPTVHTYFSKSGWVNEDIMMLWINDVLVPWVGFRLREVGQNTAALVIDTYGAHTTQRVIEYLDSIGVELIVVPKGTTDEAQPLDINVMGPFKKKRQALWMKALLMSPDRANTAAATVERTLQSYLDITIETVLVGWRQVLGEDTDEHDE
jgi:hypothetical protein